MLDKKENYIKWGIVVFIVLFSIFLFYLNHLYGYLPGDDYIFQLKIPDEGIWGSEKINSLADLIESQINFYNNYHYRVINHTLLQLILLCPQWFFDILNTIVFLLLPCAVLSTNSKNQTQDYLKKYTALLCFIWIFHFSLGWCYWPVTGALNYTWLLIPQLMHVVHLIRHIEGDQKPGLLLGLTLFNCMANENVCVVLLCLTLFAVYKHPRNRTLWLSLLIILLGGVFMLLSPSIDKRLATQGHRAAGFISHAMEYSKRSIYYLLRYGIIILLFYTVKKAKVINDLKAKLLIGSILLANGIMIIVPLFEPRSAVFGFFLLMCLVAYFVKDAKVINWILCLLMLLSCITFLFRVQPFQELRDRVVANETLLKRNVGSDTLILNNFCDKTQRNYLLCHEINSDPTYFDNKSLSAYYSIKNIKLNDKYEDHAKRDSMFNLIVTDEKALKDFSKKAEGDFIIYHKGQMGGLEIVVENQIESSPFYIYRGIRNELGLHALYRFLPAKIQVYFSDYLEDTTYRQQENIKFKGQTYNYRFIPDIDRYKSITIGTYSFEDHSTYGKLQEINLD